MRRPSVPATNRRHAPHLTDGFLQTTPRRCYLDTLDLKIETFTVVGYGTDEFITGNAASPKAITIGPSIHPLSGDGDRTKDGCMPTNPQPALTSVSTGRTRPTRRPTEG